MAEPLGSTGIRQDVNVRVGDAALYAMTLTDEAGAPVDLTGATLAATLSARDGGVGADVALPVAETNAAGGAFTVEFTEAITNALTATDFFVAKPTHTWKLVFTGSDARPQTLIVGVVNVAAKALP